MQVPLLAALLPNVQAAHEALFKMRAHPVDSRTQRLSQEAAALDAKHDDLVRNIQGAFTLLADLSEAKSEILQLRDLLLPEGLQHTKKTYRGKAGHTALVASKLDTGTTVALKALTINDTNLLDLAQTWLDTAKKLGASEEARARLNSTNGPTASEATVARTRWIRMANALLANSELIELDEATQNTLFAALRGAEKTADSRGRVPDASEPTPAIMPLPTALATLSPNLPPNFTHPTPGIAPPVAKPHRSDPRGSFLRLKPRASDTGIRFARDQTVRDRYLVTPRHGSTRVNRYLVTPRQGSNRARPTPVYTFPWFRPRVTDPRIPLGTVQTAQTDIR